LKIDEWEKRYQPIHTIKGHWHHRYYVAKAGETWGLSAC